MITSLKLDARSHSIMYQLVYILYPIWLFSHAILFICSAFWEKQQTLLFFSKYLSILVLNANHINIWLLDFCSNYHYLPLKNCFYDVIFPFWYPEYCCYYYVKYGLIFWTAFYWLLISSTYACSLLPS